MLSNRNWIILGIAALLGIVAVIIANSFLSGVEQRDQKAEADARLVQIAVARVPMAYGNTLTSENVRMIAWPVNSVPEGAFLSTKALLGGPDRRVALRPIEAGEPILPGKITGPGGRASLSNLLDPAKRAVTISVSAVTGVAGFVLPGDSVDIMLTRQPRVSDGGTADQITDILMQNVRILATDQVSSEKANKPKISRTMTVEVDQQGAQQLTLASTVGTLSMALRNVENQDVVLASTVGTRDLGRGDYGPSYYPPERRNSASSMAAVPLPYYPLTPPASVSRQPRSQTADLPPKPRNGVGVEIVRGTASTTYDVSRHRGY
jgi:pilus assembly protein CpaB